MATPLNSKINWPALVKFSGNDELIFVANEQQWLNDEELQLYLTIEQDVLIDSQGQLFLMNELQPQFAQTEPIPHLATLDNVTELIQSHFACLNQCCVSKLHPTSIAEAIKSLQIQQSA